MGTLTGRWLPAAGYRPLAAGRWPLAATGGGGGVFKEGIDVKLMPITEQDADFFLAKSGKLIQSLKKFLYLKIDETK